MSLFKRLHLTLRSRVDHLVSEIENHDAVIEAAIGEARRSVAKSKVRLAGLRGEVARLCRRLSELRKAEHQWADRARNTAAEDEEKALACLRRRKECQREAAAIEEALGRHQALEQRLAQDLRQAEERVAEMARQRNLMRSRESAAEALSSIAGMDQHVGTDLDETFERWEVRITAAELEAGTTDLDDPLERDFVEGEEREALQAELAALITEGRRDDD